MNDRALLRSLIEKDNMSKNYQRQAQERLLKNNMNPSAEQCVLLQRAADLESEMASLTIGSEKNSHIREMNRLDEECARIKAALERENAPVKSKGTTPPAKGSKQTAPENAGKTQEEIEIDRAVRTWYKEAPRISFEDVSGMEELKNKLHGCIADSQANDLRAYLQIPKLNSYFFVGPPGCGKTFICEAFAHELMDKDYKFISILGSDIISKYAGTAEKSVTRLFDEAMKNAPCIVFIDEIDSLCKNRSLPNLPEYAANITTSFLTGYNKIHSADSDVIFMAATNYPNRVDAAMLDRAEIIRLPLPDAAARKAAFERALSYKLESEDKNVEYKPIVHLKKDLTYDIMAEKTWRFNYRDIERLTSALKKILFRELVDFYGDQKLAIEALESGEYKLTLKKFESILEKFKPSPKEEILRDLLAWEKKVQSMADIAETNLSSLYDCESPNGTSPLLEDESNNSDVPKTETVQENIKSADPVYALDKEFTLNPMLGTAEIRFAIGAREPHHPIAVVDGEEMDLSKIEEGYSFVYQPDEDNCTIVVSVKDDEGFIGKFSAFIKSAISDNEDFDI